MQGTRGINYTVENIQAAKLPQTQTSSNPVIRQPTTKTPQQLADHETGRRTDQIEYYIPSTMKKKLVLYLRQQRF